MLLFRVRNGRRFHVQQLSLGGLELEGHELLRAALDLARRLRSRCRLRHQGRRVDGQQRTHAEREGEGTEEGGADGGGTVGVTGDGRGGRGR